MRFARENNNDVIIIDTAGRLHIDEPLMQELSNIKEIAPVSYTHLDVYKRQELKRY